MNEALLLVLHIPGTIEAGFDADDVADQLVDAINEDRRDRHGKAGHPEPYEPVTVAVLPVPPQWLDTRAQQMLLKAVQIVNFGYGPDTKPEGAKEQPDDGH